MEKLKEKTKFFTNTKICALMLLVAIITNMFSPYSVLLQESQAATPAAGEPYYELSIRPIDDVNTVDEDNWTDETYYYYYDYYQGTVDTTDNYSGTRVVFIDLKVKGSSTVNGADINLKYDNSKLIPAQESYTGSGKNKKYFIQNATGFTNSNSKSNQDFATIGWGTQAINELYTDESRIRTGGAVAPGQQYISDGEVVGTFMFKLADGMTLEDLDTSTFSLVPATGLSEGLQVVYWPNRVQKSVVGSDYLKFDGFATSAKKTLTNIAIKTQPTKTEYYNTEKLDLTNGVLTATYSDNTTEDINMKDALTSGDLTLGATTANANKKTTLNYQGKTVDFSYYLLDSINVNKQLTKMNYEHGDTIDYTGGELNAVYKNASGVSKTKVLNIKDSIASKELTTSATKANVDKPTITYTYHYKTATMNLSITDPVTSISITKQPTTLTYNDGDTINLTGGQITPRTKSGKSLTAVDMTNNKVTVNKKVANINDVPVASRWTIAGGDGLQAGNQTITVTYEGKTASFDIVVNDTISSVSVTTQPTASNKYGTPANQLKFDGVVATVSTTGGGKFTVGANSLKIDTSKYNPKTLTEQQFSVSYGTETATNKIKLTLKNYATGVTVKFPTTQFNYNTTLDEVIEDATYVENYADGTKSIDKPIAKSMVSGYVQRPEASLFDTKHQYDENLTITTGEFTNNQIVTIKDILNNISIGTKPNKITFGYGETFTSNGGVINGNYASGAIAKISIGNSNVTLTEADGSPINMSPAASEFTNGKATKAIKVTYTENGKQYTTTYNIKIEDEISKIEMVTNPKREYKYKEPLSTANGTIKVTYKSTLTDTIKLEDATVTETSGKAFDNTILGTRNLTVTYGGKTTSYEVNVKDYVTGISIAPNAITGKYNSELQDLINNNNIMYTITYAKAGAKTPVALTESMVSGYNKTKVTDQALTITYQDEDPISATNGQKFIANLKVSLDNPTQSIAIKTQPTKTEYGYGDTIDLSNGKITITKANGDTEEKALTDSSVKVTETDGSTVDLTKVTFGKDNTATKTIKVTYDGKDTTYQIKVTNKITGIKMHTTPKAQYNVNDAIDLTTDGSNPGEILVTRQTGTPSVVSIKDVKVKVTGFDSSKENTKLPLTVSYTENGETKTTTYNVSVKDTVTAISMKKTPKTEYKYNEPLDLSNGTITITKGSGTKDIAITENMVSGYDPTKLGKQTITITYGGKTTSYEVNVKDYVTGISITPNAITGTYNDELEALINENDIIYTVTYAKAGATSPRALTESMVAGYNKTSLTAQNLTVTYTDKDANSYTNGKTFTTTLGIKLDNNVAKITITPPTKAEYNHGDKIDLTGGKITVTYTDGTTKEEPITSAVITEKDGGALNMNPTISEYGKDNKLSKTLTLKYTAKNGVTGTTSYPITIANTIQSVAIDTLPTKVKYNIKDTLDTTGGKLKITRATGKAETIDITKDMVSGFDSSKENTKLPLTISYTENGVTKTTTYTVSVEDPITSMTLKTTPKTEYKYGEPLDISKGVITIVRPSGPEDKQITKEMVTGYDPTKLGQQELTIKYGGQELKYKVNVKDYVKGIVLTPPAKTKYEYGESLDLTGGNIQKIMASGTATTPIALTDSQVKLSTFNPNKEGAQTINVAYEGFTEKFGVIVEDNLQSIKIKTEPTKTKYKYGEALDITGGQISAIKSSGKAENIDITTSMVSGYNPNKLGKQTITITYKGKTTQYSVEVEDYIKDIKLTNPNKLIYKVNEKMDLTGGKVTPVMASGIASPAIPMTNTDVTITGFDTTTVGAKIVKVSYKGISKTFGITVEDRYSEMKIKTLPTKTEYKYGESLDLTGGTIEITKDSGTKETINITKDMISGYNSKKLGSQILTVTYQGLTQQFVVKVEDYIASLKIQKPTKVEYEYGDDIELTGGKVSIIMASGAISESTVMTGAMITGYNPKAEGTQTIKVEYKGLQGNFQVKVEDKIKGISVNTEPDKTEYKYGENLDITGATIDVVKSSGITTIPVTPNMISGFSATTPGTQIIKITYGGFTTKFVVKVSEKQEEPKQDDNKKEDNKDNGTKEDNTTNKNEEITKDNNSTKKNYVEIERNDVTENQEQPEEQQPEEEVKKPTITKENPTKVPETKPTETLGVKDEKAEDKGTKDNSSKQKASIICLIAAILLLILLSCRRNVKIYVKENGEFVLGGLDKISKNNKYIDVDKYLDGDTYEKQVKIVLSDSISEKLDKDKIEIKHRGNKKNYKIKYEGKEIEIILK